MLFLSEIYLSAFRQNRFQTGAPKNAPKASVVIHPIIWPHRELLYTPHRVYSGPLSSVLAKNSLPQLLAKKKEKNITQNVQVNDFLTTFTIPKLFQNME